MENSINEWTVCPACKGEGKRRRRLPNKVRLQYQATLDAFEKKGAVGNPPVRPKGHLFVCPSCDGSGLALVSAVDDPLLGNENYPHVAIIGGGIGGMALAVACLQRGIPFTLYERDADFNMRSQGYGLTLQQASKAIKGLGIFDLEGGVNSTRHLVHTVEGEVLGEWGMRKWVPLKDNDYTKRSNIHIARQSLRQAIMGQLEGDDRVQWGHQLLDFEERQGGGVLLTFNVSGEIKQTKADLVVGADGIRSVVRKKLIGDGVTPLRYLDCMVILGICPLQELTDLGSPLLDSATVFQTANGKERIYVMPYTHDSVMWQLSFPITEEAALALSAQGPRALKEEACRITQWHDPIPQIVGRTAETLISGYPVYDRALLGAELLKDAGNVTLIGDAAHPMSPFKGQGANQALLDALALARGIARGCRSPHWREQGLRDAVLTEFESEMLERSSVKVKDSAAAAQFLHSETVLHVGDEPRGRCLKKK
ncbi:FAD-dependent oxidoreductase [Sphingobacterium psychroaquaticum]|uniref:2-polyprenyl-6-methoxyphenol hydroxylase n=1 Tax=Sphingobacterium psychroaquaticum TaxID=561061 RepID=A0A1X7IZ43_9SPHI|nr:NAD(P)/FAD-dependent oxidoreductase [Sphingobacterium psychroaquaticum]SMG20169.1 2-polyprenyl-6-methoxyphenol hydroxylase [Sphingobacterium psychroaquaticum]